jgi:hypothetical protein
VQLFTTAFPTFVSALKSPRGRFPFAGLDNSRPQIAWQSHRQTPDDLSIDEIVGHKCILDLISWVLKNGRLDRDVRKR